MICGEATGKHEAWRQAAALSARRHVVWLDKPFDRVLTVMPAMYQDLWTAAKGVYKTEPAVADGGEVVVYAPHVREASRVHGHVINQIGYHCRDYFLAQWDRFGRFPLGILAHSTHVKGPAPTTPPTHRSRRASSDARDGHPARAVRHLSLGTPDRPTSI
jgi:nickel-dependent lactate racemase